MKDKKMNSYLKVLCKKDIIISKELIKSELSMENVCIGLIGNLCELNKLESEDDKNEYIEMNMDMIGKEGDEYVVGEDSGYYYSLYNVK
jgi:hypothetical protein